MKKILLLFFFLLQFIPTKAQICIDSKELYNNDGLYISYCTVSLGKDGLCNKYEVTISISNTSSVKKSIAGSTIVISNDIGPWPPANSCSASDDIDIPFPGQNYGYSTEMNPGYSFSKKHIIYTSKSLPAVSSYITPSNKGVTGVWSDPKTTSCYPKLQYQVKTEELYNLNYQVHMYFRVKSSYNEPVKFVFELLNAKGEKEFGDLHSLQPGETKEFMHKMSGLYVKGVRISKAEFANGTPLACDGNDNENANGEKIDRQLIDEINSYLHQIDDNNPTKKAIMQRVINAQNNKSLSYKDYLILLKNEKENAKKLFESLGKTTDTQNSSFDELTQQEISLVQEIKAIEPSADVYIWEGNINDKPEYTLQKKKENISKLENYLEGIKTNATNAIKEKEAQEAQKAAEKDAFNSNMQKGNEAMGSKNYDAAMSYYQTAKNSTTDVNDQTLAQNKYDQALESKKTDEAKVRIEKQQEQDKKEDIQYAAMATGVAGAMAVTKDNYSSEWYAMKYQIGLGCESSPIISNNVNEYHTNQSYIESFFLPTFHAGFKSGFFNNKGISLYINPQLNLGFSALSAGTSGGYFEYGSTATVYFGLKPDSKFKFFAEGGYFKKDGTFSYDADAAAAGGEPVTGEGATNDVREGTFNYSILKYGGGVLIQWIDDDEETYIRPAAYLETASFFEGDTKPVLNLNLQVNISSMFIIDLNYAKNYFIAGELKYPTTLTAENKDFFSIRIIRQGKLF